MKKINKNLMKFVIIISFLGFFSLIVLQKLLPFAQYTTYYCQSLISSFLTPISHYIGAIPFVLLFIFSIVATIKLLIIVIKAKLLKKKLSKKSLKTHSFSVILEKLELTDKTYIIASEKRFAFCLGIRNPKIYLSTGLATLLNTQEIEAVLLHEKYHLDKRDTLIMLIASVGESLLPFFPLLSDFLYNYRIEREIKADQEAIRGIGDKKPLIAVLKKMLGTSTYAEVSLAAIADQDTLEPRILSLIKKDTHFKRFQIHHIVVSILSAFIMGTIMIIPVQAFEIHHQGKNVLMICPQGNINEKDHSEDILYSPMK
jgi:beta-lactamase regulating signal transducer with metallopeptidase domain